MQVIRGLSQPFGRPTAITVGNFDGCHIGHQAMFAYLKRCAAERGLVSMVIFFEPQPREYFSSEAPCRLMSRQQKLRFLADVGIEVAVCLPFGDALANMPAETFFKRQLCRRLNAGYMLVGEDFRCGKDRLGDVEKLQIWAKPKQVALEIFAAQYCHGVRVSSSKIREALLSGALSKAAEWLGRPYTLSGKVIYGRQLATAMGVPTANISLRSWPRVPLRGVFLTQASIRGGDWLDAVANIGCRPTVDGSRLLLEVHLLKGIHQLYGKHLEVRFIRKIRDEKAFESVAMLKQQIQYDIALAREWASDREPL